MTDITELGHVIGGRSVAGTSGATGPVYNPSTGRQTGAVALAAPDEVDHVVATAHTAWLEWRHSSVATRTKAMFALRGLVDRHADELAAKITAEHGKVHSDALGEVARGLENIEFACNIGEMLKGSHSNQVSGGVDVTTIRRPLGVVAGITPFNFPVMVPLWMWPMAVACGNTFVLKPSEKVPLSAMREVELAHEAGLPPGVLNLVTGGPDDKTAGFEILLGGGPLVGPRLAELRDIVVAGDFAVGEGTLALEDVEPAYREAERAGEVPGLGSGTQVV